MHEKATTTLCLVTGAAGYVGRWLVRHLTESGYNVRAMARNSRRQEELEEMGASVVFADLRDDKSVRQAMEGVTHVFHIAALFRQAGLPDSEYTLVNVDGVRNVFEAAIECGVKRLVHCSTNGVHKVEGREAIDEKSPFNPGDVYQRSKLEGEKLAQRFFDSGNMRGAIIRPGMIYGPGDERFLKLFRMVAQERFFYVGKGTASTHWIDVRDLTRAFELAMFNDSSNGEAYLIAGNPPLALNEMCTKIAEKLGVRAPWIHLPATPMLILGDLCEAICTPLNIPPPIFRRRVNFYLKSRCFNTSKAQKHLGFAPAQSIDREIDDIIQSYREAGQI